MRKSEGFSLIEMMIVIAILGIVLAIATPNFMAYRQNTNLKEATRELSSDIQYWKQKAVSENRRYQILLDEVANRYSILKEHPAGSGNYVQLSVADPTLQDITKSPADISTGIIILNQTFLDNAIIIQPRGTLSMGTINLKHNIRESTAQIVTNVTGRVKVDYVLK